MLGLKSLRTAAVTLSGIELAHRIRKRQFTVPYEHKGRRRSLKELWEQALACNDASAAFDNADLPLTHQISIRSSPVRSLGRRAAAPIVRYARKISLGRSLYLLITPNGARYWRYRYYFEGREKMMSLGRYPEVPTESAWARHRAARQLLAAGIDPVCCRNTLRRISAGPSTMPIKGTRRPPEG
jgi:hypothetical protein